MTSLTLHVFSCQVVVVLDVKDFTDAVVDALGMKWMSTRRALGSPSATFAVASTGKASFDSMAQVAAECCGVRQEEGNTTTSGQCSAFPSQQRAPFQSIHDQWDSCLAPSPVVAYCCSPWPVSSTYLPEQIGEKIYSMIQDLRMVM